MSNFSIREHSHRRLNILTGEWILVSPHRTKRPWQGKIEKPAQDNRPSYDPQCYLCPGNERVGGLKNPDYQNTFVFSNDFAALMHHSEEGTWQDGLLTAKSEKGICKVMCFSPNHALTIPEMDINSLENIISTWQAQYLDLGRMDFINYVQIFENKGELMGCSNPHPHGQIWAQSSIPMEVQKKSQKQKEYWELKNKTLIADYLQQELASQERIIIENNSFVALVPFWATWPYEVMICPIRPMPHIGQLSPQEKTDFAQILQATTTRLDNLFETSFPYSMGIHQCPTHKGHNYPEWHWHVSFYPPLLRSATVKKFMVGYEMFAEAQRDISPEMAADKLRNLSEVHYKVKHK
ncbi:MAG: UDP-glucose--hexose-1-phosphate uridylyltransferase [Microscillaceae bacterium]|nr:UDP-glucose--hexose-1-phosphate uridylyltransferase [Microscillaceae bacterium]